MRELNQAELETNAETMRHILTVRTLLTQCIGELVERGNAHDLSKLRDPELDLFVEYTPKLKEVVYGSEEYKGFLKALKPALDNHYANNSHHPEHYANGIDDMNLLDVLEMLIDWKASSLRGKGGSLAKSLEIQKERFQISDQLYKVLSNTVELINKFGDEANIKVSYPD